jgi:hypothetical protein
MGDGFNLKPNSLQELSFGAFQDNLLNDAGSQRWSILPIIGTRKFEAITHPFLNWDKTIPTPALIVAWIANLKKSLP